MEPTNTSCTAEHITAAVVSVVCLVLGLAIGVAYEQLRSVNSTQPQPIVIDTSTTSTPSEPTTDAIEYTEKREIVRDVPVMQPYYTSATWKMELVDEKSVVFFRSQEELYDGFETATVSGVRYTLEVPSWSTGTDDNFLLNNFWESSFVSYYEGVLPSLGFYEQTLEKMFITTHSFTRKRGNMYEVVYVVTDRGLNEDCDESERSGILELCPNPVNSVKLELFISDPFTHE